MGLVDGDNIKFYQCATWTEGSTHGGAIDTGNEITSGADENVFDDVSNAERLAGDTEYRKIFIRNESPNDTWEGVKCWIDTFTPATNDEITIASGTSSDVQTTATGYSYVSPDSKTHGDVITLGNIAQDGSMSIWIKRVVTASGEGYTDNNFKIAFESS